MVKHIESYRWPVHRQSGLPALPVNGDLGKRAGLGLRIVRLVRGRTIMMLRKGHFGAGAKGMIPVLPLIVAVLLLGVPRWAVAQEAFPTQIRGVKMGTSMAAVISMIKGSGTYEKQPLPLPQRIALVWTPQVSQYYKQVQFYFTEKDRLFLIRFKLKDISFRDFRGLKKDLFEKYGISWNDPWRLQIKENDVLLYGPPEKGRVYYFELTNPKTGEKAMELLDQAISKEDRSPSPVAKAKQKEAGSKPGSGELEPGKHAAESGPLQQPKPAKKAAGGEQEQGENSTPPK
jgi:hypothetical protein